MSKPLPTKMQHQEAPAKPLQMAPSGSVVSWDEYVARSTEGKPEKSITKPPLSARLACIRHLQDMSDQDFENKYPDLRRAFESDRSGVIKASLLAKDEILPRYISKVADEYYDEEVINAAFLKKPLEVLPDRLAKLPKRYNWPSARYSDAARNGVDIVSFLEEKWLPLMDVGADEMRWLRRIDPTAVSGINNYQSKIDSDGKRNFIPKHLRFLPQSLATDRRVFHQGGPERLIETNPRLARTLAARYQKLFG